MTKRYNELGEKNYEKWFLLEGLIHGNIEIFTNSNKILQKLNHLYNLLWNDNTFKQSYNIKNYAFENIIRAKTETEKVLISKKYERVKEDIANYISFFMIFIFLDLKI